MSDPRPCGTCKAPVLDLNHSRTGKPAPIDAEPSADGNILVSRDHGTYVIVSAKDRDSIGLPMHKNHWATCPDAAKWRERYKRGESGPGMR